MGKINWGTTAQVAGALAPAIGSNIKGAIKKQPTGNDSASKSNSMAEDADAGSFKRGGPVRKTGLARVHKGERVLTKKQNRKYQSKKR